MTRAFTSALFGAATLALSAGFLTATTTPAAACSDSPYMGSVCFMGGNFCPYGYVAANGALLPIQQNQALYSIIGTYYGGDGKTNFALPDMRGRGPVGWGTGVGLAAVAPGQMVGQESVMLSQTQMAPHTHAATFNPTGGGSGGTQQVVVPAVPSTLGVTATPNLTASGTANLPVNGSVSLKIGVSSVSGSAAAFGAGANFAKGGGTANVYTATAADTVLGSAQTVSGTATGTVNSTVSGTINTSITGSPGNPEIKFNVPTGGITGGTVTVGSNFPQGVSQVATPTRSPSLGLTACIATAGSYPVRP